MATYNVTIHTDASAALDANHRLSIIRFKTPTDKKDDKTYSRPVARCVSVPHVVLMIQPDSIKAALTACYEELQDAVIREIIVQALEAGPTDSTGKLRVITVSDEQLSYEAVAAYSARVAVSGKLSAKVLQDWFDTDLKDNLTVALAAVLKLPDEPTSDQLAKLEAAVMQHRSMIASLASPKAQMPEKLTKQLNRAVMLAEQSKIRDSITAKLAAFLQPKEVALSLGLGEEE